MAKRDVKAVSLGDAAHFLEHLCEEIDDFGGDVDAYMHERFDLAIADLAEACNRRVRFMRYAEHAAEGARKEAERWRKRAAALEASHDWIRSITMQVMIQNPGLPFKGSEGTFRIYRNATPTLRVDEALLPDSFLKIRCEPDKEKIKEALLRGESVPGALLEHGQHIRIV